MKPRRAIYAGSNRDQFKALSEGMPDFEWNFFPDGSETEEQIREFRPDLFILEAQACSYEVSGYINWLKKALDPTKTIIFLLTEQDDKRDYLPLLKLGIDDIYTMPANPEVISTRFQLLGEYQPKKEFTPLTPEKFEYRIPLIKRLFDILFAGTALLLLSPLMLLVALAIRLESKGPVFYASKRVGTGFRIFDFYKFRSMYVDADQRIKDLKKLNQYAANAEKKEIKAVNDFSLGNDEIALFGDEGKVDEQSFIEKMKAEAEVSFVKIKDDPRITKVGRFIRNTSIDELPQLINVLKGDMSIVGNRPIPLYEAELLTTDEWIERFIAPAGLTGLWQVEKRAKSTEMSPEERKMLDNEYARSFNFWKDLKIIFRTFRAVFQSESV
ncbi:MAG: sugar transferase [Bacteroidales bacterium]